MKNIRENPKTRENPTLNEKAKIVGSLFTMAKIKGIVMLKPIKLITSPRIYWKNL